MSVFSFHTFLFYIILVSKKWNIETILTLPYSYNWQKFNNKMNEKRSQKYQSMDPEYVTGQINSHSGASFDTILLFNFCTALKILICFSLTKHFPKDHKRYSSHLQVSVLHQVAPIKVYLTIYESLKNSYLKKVFIHTINI